MSLLLSTSLLTEVAATSLMIVPIALAVGCLCSVLDCVAIVRQSETASYTKLNKEGSDMSYKPVPLAERCQEEGVPNADGGRSVFSHRCFRKATVVEGGERWCRQHAPSLVAARRTKANAEWEKKYIAERDVAIAVDRQWAEDARKLAAFPGLLAACENAAALVVRLVSYALSPPFSPHQLEEVEMALRLAIAKAKEE
mgnify:CR=1 FL=1